MEVGSLSTTATTTTFTTKVVWKVSGFQKKCVNLDGKSVKLRSASFCFCYRWWHIFLRTEGKENSPQDLGLFLRPEKLGNYDVSVNTTFTLFAHGSSSVCRNKIVSRGFTHTFLKGLDSSFGFPKFVEVKVIDRSDVTVELSISATIRAEDFPYFMDENTVQNNLKLLQSAVAPDIIITVEEREFVAHKDVLTAQSEVFKRMFNTEMTESKSRKIVVLDAKAEVFETFLNFLYTGTCPENLNVLAEDLFALSHKYEVKSLGRLCIAHFEKKDLDHKAAADLLLLSDKYSSLGNIQDRIVDYLKDNLDFLESPEWKELKTKAPAPAFELLTLCLKRYVKK